jgi:D-3-phosphoglycerate dehydrogenase
VDNIAVETATQEGIVVTYLPDYCVDEVSDHVLALLLAWNRQLGFYDAAAKRGQWGGLTPPVPLVRLRGSRLGIIGLGRIGQAVAVKARAFGLELLGYDPHLPLDAALPVAVRRVDLPTLLAESDYITLHTPLNEATRGLIGAREFAMMKDSAFIINCARGPIIDEDALYHALRDRRIAGAGLDVLERADPPPEHPLFQLDNLLVTPHVAFLSQQSVHELEVRTAQATADVLRGRRPQFLVNPEVLPRARAVWSGNQESPN